MNHEFFSLIQNLYNLGARKFVLTTIYPIGSSPMVNLNQPNCGPCSQALNVAAAVYNIHLKSLVEDMKPRMPGSNFVVVNTYDIVKDIIDNPASKGKHYSFFVLHNIICFTN